MLPDTELVLKFESLGDNCELGLVQRRVGVEPLGLLRFAGTPLRNLLRAMQGRFADMTDPGDIRIVPENGEYMVKLAKYDFIYHADVRVGEVEPGMLHQQQVRTVGFLVRKLLDDLDNPSKIMVFRQNEPLSADDLTDLRLALAAYGPATLLWVQAARPGHPANTVVKVDDRLMVGFVRRLALREQVPDLDLPSWLTVLRKAYTLFQATGGQGIAPHDAASQGIGNETPPAPAHVELIFGRDGNASGCIGFGWSAPEDGYTWAIGDRSVLTISNPGPADELWLEFDVAPFVAPPAVPFQSMTVTVNGQQVHTFESLARGRVGCSVPGLYLNGLDSVVIVLDHPDAAVPSQVHGGNDDRWLAVAFRSLSLRCH